MRFGSWLKKGEARLRAYTERGGMHGDDEDDEVDNDDYMEEEDHSKKCKPKAPSSRSTSKVDQKLEF